MALEWGANLSAETTCHGNLEQDIGILTVNCYRILVEVSRERKEGLEFSEDGDEFLVIVIAYRVSRPGTNSMGAPTLSALGITTVFF